jgi:Bacterial capsule synthesis protein PGA_cap
VHYEIDPGDLAEVRQAIRQGKQHSDLLIATIHSHETGLGCEEPGDFLPALARASIDAGAGVFIAHGEHRLMPIEIYKGRPIFYSLANFFWSDILEPIPAETYEANQDLLTKAYGAASRPTDADLLTAWNAEAFDDPRVFETIIAVTRWERGRVSEVRLHPVDLGYGRRLTESGTPRLASPEMARSILERLQRISKPYGTRIEIEEGVGIIRLR